MHISHSVLIFIGIACSFTNLIRSETGGGAKQPPAPGGNNLVTNLPATKTDTTDAGLTAATTQKPPTPEAIAEFVKKATEEQEKVLKETAYDPKLLEIGDKIIKIPETDIPEEELNSNPFKVASPGKPRRRRRLWKRGYYSKIKPFLEVNRVSNLGATSYLVKNLLGSGTYGEVYSAEMKTTKDPIPVALKACPRYYTPDNQPREDSDPYKKLRLEFNLIKEIAKINNICKNYLVNFIDIAQDEEIAVIIMELAENGDLESYVASNTVNVKYFPILVTEMIYGILCIHKVGYSHGDIKPENVLVRKDSNNQPQAAVADFGFASSKKSRIARPGTRIFTAPEVFDNSGNVDKFKADAFSIGATILSMYIKKTPPRLPIRKDIQGKDVYGPIIFTKRMFVSNKIPLLVADLIQRLCWPIPAQRMTLEEALRHPFLSPGIKPNEYFRTNPIPVDPTGETNYQLLDDAVLHNDIVVSPPQVIKYASAGTGSDPAKAATEPMGMKYPALHTSDRTTEPMGLKYSPL